MVYLIFMLLISLAVALFAVQNAMSVDVTFMTWSFTTSLVMVIILSLLAGIIIALFWLLKQKTTNYMQVKKLKEQIDELENKNSKLVEENNMLMHTQKQRLEQDKLVITDKPV
ncbi:MAG TPA: LapA family protein [Candidatus Avacidaminococcus intestinavium]|uniref:LapA family protein n=1 Tax=Candidatus Avacidaminococcus intestinavium TaxID=2840684 RepID=A0A9D1MRE0_9FIRM|nr:LapA family protein [Candidatus Avacidaminococcus intestinavium]